MKANTISALQQRLWDDWTDCERSGVKPEDVLTGAREVMDLQISDEQIEETCAHYRYAPDWTSRDEEVSDQIREATDSEDPDKLYAWLEWIEGDQTAAEIVEYLEEKDEGPDQWGYYSYPV